MKLRNVTITLEEDVARWARIRAAKDNTSVSRLLGEVLKELMKREDTYATAMKEYLAGASASLKKSGRYPRREDLHDRPRLR